MEIVDAEKTDKLKEYRIKTGWTGPNGSFHNQNGRTVPIQSLQQRRAELFEFLRIGIQIRYEKAEGLAYEIQKVLFEPEKGDLMPDDRQRCLITLLATRPEQFPLAIHIYVGLMEGIPVGEIRNILFLVGVYSGVPGMVNGIDVLERVLKIIEEYEAEPAETVQKVVLGRLKEEFSPGISQALLVQAFKNFAIQADHKITVDASSLGVRKS